jgi:N-acetylmuramoyl-L-alanine amidase
MPSVLTEISFLSNPEEARLLKQDAYRQQVAEALFEAIQNYQRTLKNVQVAARP